MKHVIRQHVTIGPGGQVTLRLPDLQEGQRVEVIVMPGSLNASSSESDTTPTTTGAIFQYAGAGLSDDPRGSDNASIDADLVKEYARGLDGDV